MPCYIQGGHNKIGHTSTRCTHAQTQTHDNLACRMYQGAAPVTKNTTTLWVLRLCTQALPPCTAATSPPLHPSLPSCCPCCHYVVAAPLHAAAAALQAAAAFFVSCPAASALHCGVLVAALGAAGWASCGAGGCGCCAVAPPPQATAASVVVLLGRPLGPGQCHRVGVLKGCPTLPQGFTVRVPALFSESVTNSTRKKNKKSWARSSSCRSVLPPLTVREGRLRRPCWPGGCSWGCCARGPR
jgi:hypothetical protein